MRWYEKLACTVGAILLALFVIDHLRTVAGSMQASAKTNAVTAASSLRSAVADERLADVHAGVLAIETAAVEASTFGSQWSSPKMQHTVTTPIHEPHRLEDLQRHMAVVADAVVITERQ